MQLTPHYGSEPLLTIDGDPGAIAEPAIRQRRRLAATLADFTDEQWEHSTRCEGWTARDVVIHLDGTNAFWTQSITAGRHGEPTRFLASFDPVTTPATSVARSQELTVDEVLSRFVDSTDTLTRLLETLDGSEWTTLAEAPPGHLTTSAVVHHALWDAWIHERDILVPLSRDPVDEPDEVAACLRYAAALGPTLALTRGARRRGALRVDATEPETSFVVDIGKRVHVGTGGRDPDVTLTGRAADLVDALSVRQPLEHRVPREHSWMVSGLSEIFDNEP
jgi:uncharacterized protein (TIGR03083 family)